MKMRPRTVAERWQIACPKTTIGTWSGGVYGCTFRIYHEGECNRDRVIEPGVMQAPYVHSWT